MQCPYDVRARRVGEEAELGAGARVEVQQVVRAGGGVEPEVEIEDAPVAERGDHLARQPLHGGVGQPAAHGRQPGPGRPGPFLAPGGAHQERAVTAAVAVEEPVETAPRRQPFLEQQPAPRLGAAAEQLPGLAPRAHHDGAAQPGALRQQPGPAPLGDRGQPERARRAGGLLAVAGDGRAGMGQPQRGAERGEFRLVGDALGQVRWLCGQQVAARQPGPEAGDHDRAQIVQGDEDGGDAEPLRDPQQQLVQGVRRGPVGPPVRAAQIAGRGDRAVHRLDDRVHRDSGPAEGSDGAEGSVMERIPVEPYEHGRDADVKARHGVSFILDDPCGG